MSLCCNLSWNRKRDCVEGFEDFGYRTSSNIANHAQVFMVRSIYSNWKQPVFFNFVNGNTNYVDIARILKKVIRILHDIGLTVLATVCDQGTNNCATIKYLKTETRQEYLRNGREFDDGFFQIHGLPAVTPIFDTPHLLKGIRNNLLVKDVQFGMEGVKMTAKWQHIYKAYEIDRGLGTLRLMPKLTEQHVDSNKLKKMKVSCCSQVFSHTVAAAINLMAANGVAADSAEDRISTPPEAVHTAKFVEFFDALFDSVNGSQIFKRHGKLLRTAATAKSGHVSFWRHAITILCTVVYIDPLTKKESVPPSVKNWIVTLKGLISLHEKMLKLGFKHMQCRKFNQDPVENFFGQIRQRGGRFTNPTPTAFVAFYKSLLVKTFTSSHSVGANCENDNTEMLVTLQRYVLQGLPEEEEDEENLDVQISTLKPYLFNKRCNVRRIDKQVIGYISGFITKKLLPKFRSCNIPCVPRNLKHPD